MAEERIADVIVPEVFYPYIMERSFNENVFARAGVLIQNAQMAEFLAGGGKTFNIPYWKDLTGVLDVPSETVATTINNIASDKMIGIRQFREKAWGANVLSGELAGSDPYTAIGNRVAGFWSRGMENIILSICKGVIADNVANNSSDLVLDIAHASDGALATNANKISAIETINAIMKQGDKFSEMSTIAMHSMVYATLLKNDLIDFIPDSLTKMNIPRYLDLNVVVTDNMPRVASGSGYKYTSYLLKSGAFGYAEFAGKIKPVETWRDPSKGMGIDVLYTRKQFSVQPLGFTWDKADNSAVTPSDVDLEAATSWSRKYDAKNVGLIALVSNM